MEIKPGCFKRWPSGAANMMIHVALLLLSQAALKCSSVTHKFCWPPAGGNRVCAKAFLALLPLALSSCLRCMSLTAVLPRLIDMRLFGLRFTYGLSQLSKPAQRVVALHAHQLHERWQEEIDLWVLEHGHEFECNSECDLCDSPNFEW